VALESFTVVFLLNGPGGEPQTDDERAATQDAHLAHLADLHDEGVLIAAGPLPDSEWGTRGIAVLTCDAERAAELFADDPAVLAGWFTVKTVPWLAPRGAVALTDASFPRSAAEAAAG
jgi:uncharacterized protein YciI